MYIIYIENVFMIKKKMFMIFVYGVLSDFVIFNWI